MNRVLLQRARHDDAHVVAVREADIHFGDSRFGDRRPHFRRQRLVRFEQHFAGLAVHQLADRDGAFEISYADFHLRDARLHQFLVERFADALVRADQHSPDFGCLISRAELAVDQSFRGVPDRGRRRAVRCARPGRMCAAHPHSTSFPARAGKSSRGTCACGRCGRTEYSLCRTRIPPMIRGTE